MRFTTAALMMTLSTACMAPVGGGEPGRDRDGDDDHETSKNCKKVEEDVTIRTADDFAALEDGCWDLYGTLTLEGSQITSLAGLGKLSATDGLVLDGTAISSIDTAQVLRAYGRVTIRNNAKLTSLANLEVENPDGLIIDNNVLLTSLGKVADVGLIGGPLTINANPKLADVTLPNLKSVAEPIRVTNNAALAKLDMTQLDTVGSIEITNNVALQSFAGMYANRIDGDFTLRGNRALTSIGSMASLSSIAGSLTIDDNDALAQISGFTGALEFVTGFVTITNNGALTDLGQVSHMSGIGAIRITSNPSLSACRATEVDRCVTQHGAVTIQFNKDDTNCDYWCN